MSPSSTKSRPSSGSITFVSASSTSSALTMGNQVSSLASPPMILLLAIFVFVPIAELYVIFKIGDAIGWQWTLLLLVIDSLLGTWLMKSQGRAVWGRFQLAMQEGRVPHREVL